MFPRIANKEIKIDKILQDLPLFTVLLSRALARGFLDVSMELNPFTLFRASSTDYHPCVCAKCFNQYLFSITEGKKKSNQVVLCLILCLCQRSLRLCEVFSF